MTAKVRIVPRNFHDEATLTASEAASGFPATNTQNTGRDSAWRSTSTGTVTISGSFTRNRVVSFIGMFRHRNHGGNIRAQFYSDNAWTTPASAFSDTGAVAVNKIVNASGYAWGDDPYGIGQCDPHITDSPWWYWFTPATIQSYKITLSSHSSTFWSGAYWHVSRLWLGMHFESRINPSPSTPLGVQDNSDRNRTRGGSLRTWLGARWRTLVLDLNGIDEAERTTWLQIDDWAQTGRDIVVSLFPLDATMLERDYTINGKFSALNPIGRTEQMSRLTKKIAVEAL